MARRNKSNNEFEEFFGAIIGIIIIYYLLTILFGINPASFFIGMSILVGLYILSKLK